MVKTRKLMSIVLAGVMVLSASSCSLLEQDKKTKEADPDDIIELAESFAKSVTTADADKILKNFEDISDKLDPVLQKMWGQQMFRIILTAKSAKLKDQLRYTIK